MKGGEKHRTLRDFTVLSFLLVLGTVYVRAQHINNLRADLDGENREIRIQQEFEYFNTSNDILHYLYFNDWANAYSDKNTGLAKRLGEEFNRSLHLAKDKERGYTQITSMVDEEYRGLFWKRTVELDIIRIQLNVPLRPGESAKLFITY
ncbi:MAG: metalloprotease, partial [Bacteroidota bacterium]